MRGVENSPEDWVEFVECVRRLGSVAKASKETGIGERTVYDRRSTEPGFKEQIEDAREEYVISKREIYFDEAERRAVEGIVKPIYQGGVRVDSGEVREYSDSLLSKLLERTDAQFRRNAEVNVQVDATSRPVIALPERSETMTAEEWAEVSEDGDSDGE